MQFSASSSYLLLVFGLSLKFLLLIGLQGFRRMQVRIFRWPEDAAHWSGSAGCEDPLVERAQAALRNDGESQPLFLAVAAFWLWSGANGALAWSVCALYVVARGLHSAFMLWPMQPLRNRVFGLSQLCLLVALLDCCRLAWSGP
jgi:uncharacterized MAPEG superfamily protein